MLGLKADGAAVRIGDASLSNHGAVKEIAAVDLDAGFVSRYLQADSCLRAVERCGRLSAVQDPVVVISVAVTDLLIIGINFKADNLGLTEIKRRTLHGSNLTCGHERTVHGGVCGGIDLKDVLRDTMACWPAGSPERLK